MRSISCADTNATAYARAQARICLASRARRAGVNFLESVRPSMRQSRGSTTAAAATGPANAPRPASSTPATQSRSGRDGNSSSVAGISGVWERSKSKIEAASGIVPKPGSDSRKAPRAIISAQHRAIRPPSFQ